MSTNPVLNKTAKPNLTMPFQTGISRKLLSRLRMNIVCPTFVAKLRHVLEFIYFYCDVMEPNERRIRVFKENNRQFAGHWRNEAKTNG